MFSIAFRIVFRIQFRVFSFDARTARHSTVKFVRKVRNLSAKCAGAKAQGAIMYTEGKCIRELSISRFSNRVSCQIKIFSGAVSFCRRAALIMLWPVVPFRMETRQWGAEKAHKNFFHIKLCPVTPVTGLPGRVSGQKDLCSLGSEDST